MRAPVRAAAALLILACGIWLILTLHASRTRAPLGSTFTSSFQILGAPLKLADRAASRVLPVGQLDERQLGDVYREHFDAQVARPDPRQDYLDSLVLEVRPLLKKNFPYRVYCVEDSVPNAMALPGGVVLVTRGLFSMLSNESELVSVLAHEMGHIERGHCFDAVRFTLLTRKVKVGALGQIADLAAALLMRHSFSKTMEHEADEYAFELMSHSRYDPRGLGDALRKLDLYSRNDSAPVRRRAGLFRDYFASHPPLAIREAEFRERAAAWWSGHPGDARYVGRKNLTQCVPRSRHEFADEWAQVSGYAGLILDRHTHTKPRG